MCSLLKVFPQFRSSRSGRQFDSNRTRTGQIDHDVFEGLPVRRWSRQTLTHSQIPKTEDSEFIVQGPGSTGRLPELAMPRDSQLLGASSRALLRAARAGCIYIHQNTHIADEDEKESGGGDDMTTAAHTMDRSFTSRKWMAIPKHLEPAEVEFLAKRRPGLPSLYGGATAVDGSGSGPGPMRRTKFKKTDPLTGNISIYEAWVPEGHRIEGEVTGDIQTIAEQSSVPINSEMPAPGTVVEGVGVVNSEGVVVAEAGSASVMTPPKRRPPPPKRKGKGIGKGRKKKVMFAPGEGVDAAAVHGIPHDPNSTTEGSKESHDLSQAPIDQTCQDDDEEDGEDGDDSDEGDESMMDAKTPETPQAPSVSESTDHPTIDAPIDTKDVEMADAASELQPSFVDHSSMNNKQILSSLPPAGIPTLPEDEAPSIDMDSHPSASTHPPSTLETSERAVAHIEQPSRSIDPTAIDSGSPKLSGPSLHPGPTAALKMDSEESPAHGLTPAVGSATIAQSIPTDSVQPAPEVSPHIVNSQPELIGQGVTSPAAVAAAISTAESKMIPSASAQLLSEPETTAGGLAHSKSLENLPADAMSISSEHQGNGHALVRGILEEETRSPDVAETALGSEVLKEEDTSKAASERDGNSPQAGEQYTTQPPVKHSPSPRAPVDANDPATEATEVSRVSASASSASDQSTKEPAPAFISDGDEPTGMSTGVAISGAPEPASQDASLPAEPVPIKEPSPSPEEDKDTVPLSTSSSI